MPIIEVEGFFRGIALATLGMTLTWGLSMLLGRMVARRGATRWIAGRLNTIGWVLLVVGLALAGWALSQGASAAGSSLVLLGSLVAMGGLWLITMAP